MLGAQGGYPAFLMHKWEPNLVLATAWSSAWMEELRLVALPGKADNSPWLQTSKSLLGVLQAPHPIGSRRREGAWYGGGGGGTEAPGPLEFSVAAGFP